MSDIGYPVGNYNSPKNSSAIYRNLKTYSFAASRLAMSAANNGGVPFRFLAIGDSTTFGTNGGVLGSGAYATSYISGGFLPQLGNLLVKSGLFSAFSHESGLGTRGGNNSASIVAVDPRFSFDPTTIYATFRGIGGYDFRQASINTKVFDFTPSIPIDTIETYYIQAAGLGDFNVGIDGLMALGTVATAGAAAFKSDVRNCALGNHTVNISHGGTAGNIEIAGVVCYNSTISGTIVLINGGWPGSKPSNLSAQYGFSGLQQIATFAPNLIEINLGINNWRAGTYTSPDQFKQDMRPVIAACVAVADTYLVTPIPSSPLDTPIATQQNIVQAIFDLSDEFNIPVLDLWTQRYNSQFNAVFYDNGDAVHFGRNGYRDRALATLAFFRRIYG